MTGARQAGVWQLAAALLAASSAFAAVEYRGVAKLTRQSEQIVIGDIVTVSSFWTDDQAIIKSRIVVSVDQYLVGEGTGEEVLEMSGGTVGEMSMVVSVLPVFQVGDRVLLFLGQSEIRLVESFQGAYLTDGKQVVRMAPGCTRVISDSLQPLSELLAEIQAALPRGVVLPRIKPYTGDFQLPQGNPRYGLCGFSWAYMSNPMGEPYKINPNCADSSAGDSTSQQTQIQNGAAAWNNAGAHFTFTYGGTSTQTSVAFNGTNLIFFSTNPPDGGGYVARTTIWYSGSNITECDLVFNDRDYTWWNGSGSCGGNKLDIWNTATHELGHFLCLLDLYGGGDTEKTMYGYVAYCETKKRTLEPDDINGILAIYGAGAPDNTPPTPNPMTFELPPYAAGTTSIAMRATLATDAQSPPVQYEFDFTTGGAGGTDSGWQSGRDYTDGGLTPNTLYTYRVRARDSAATPNVTGYSGEAGAYTLANVPNAPALSNPTSTTLDLDVDPSGNPASTEFAIWCSSTVDPTWNTQYVNASGNPSGSAVWQTEAAWGVITVKNLDPATQYCFQVKARNGNLIETGFSSPSCAQTQSGGVLGDMNCDGAVSFADINPFVLALTDPATWQSTYPCSILNGDINQDGLVNFGDINPFVALLSGSP